MEGKAPAKQATPWRLIIFGGLALYAVLIALLNKEQVDISFVFFSTKISKLVLIILCYYKETIQEKAITLNVKKLRAALLTEGELTEWRFLEQIEDDGLIALAKTIVNRAEEKISLESELRRLTGIEEETDIILPDSAELEEIHKDDFPRKTDESVQETVVNGQCHIESIPAVVLAESMSESPAKKDDARSQHPTQLLLFAYAS